VRIIITGANGQLGRELQRVLADHVLLATDLGPATAAMDICDYRTTLETVSEFRPDVVIHAAANTNVDGCERDPDKAFEVNALGTQNVALACQHVGAAMVYISTDYVFDGEKGEPYLELDPPNPVSAYGRSKLAGEQYVKMLLTRFYIVRTAWLYSQHGSNFVKWALKASQEQAQLVGVVDQVGSPTNAADLAHSIARLIEHERYGIYHFTNEGSCSRYDLLVRILELAGRPTFVLPMTTPEFLSRYPLPARRPANSTLRNFSAARSLGITLRHWDEALQELMCSLV